MENSEPKPKPKQINIEDMNPQQSLEALWTLINKASTKGVFNIDEAYVINVLFSKLSKQIFNENTESEEIDSKTNYNV